MHEMWVGWLMGRKHPPLRRKKKKQNQKQKTKQNKQTNKKKTKNHAPEHVDANRHSARRSQDQRVFETCDLTNKAAEFRGKRQGVHRHAGVLIDKIDAPGR
jgi:hypothetical protein